MFLLQPPPIRQIREKGIGIGMDKHVRIFLNRTSLVCSTTATAILFYILLSTTTTTVLPPTCLSHPALLKFPNSTCDASHRPRSFTTLSHRNRRRWSTSAWKSSVRSYTNLFLTLQSPPLSILSTSSMVLCVLSGAGQEVMALNNMEVNDVTGIDLVESPPLVSRADPNNLPFFDEAFDLAFCAQFDFVLFPSRVAEEMERTVRVGGHCVVLVDGESTDQEVREIAGLFRRGKMVGGAAAVVLNGVNMKRIVVKIVKGAAASSN